MPNKNERIDLPESLLKEELDNLVDQDLLDRENEEMEKEQKKLSDELEKQKNKSNNNADEENEDDNDNKERIRPKVKYYIHKKHGLRVKAYPYETGMEDGIEDKKPYMIVDRAGVKQKVIPEIGDYIVQHKGFKFIFSKSEFENWYNEA